MTTVYRIFGARRELVYVGITDDYEKRMAQHSEKAWWSELRTIETVDYDTRAEAVEAELCAIQTEFPKYNKAGTGEVSRRAPAPRRNETKKRDLMTLAEASEYARVCTKTIRRYISSGQIEACRLPGRGIRVDARDLDAMLVPIPSGRIYGR